MDNIWDGNPSKPEAIGRCGRDESNIITTQNQDSRTRNRLITLTKIGRYHLSCYGFHYNIVTEAITLTRKCYYRYNTKVNVHTPIQIYVALRYYFQTCNGWFRCKHSRCFIVDLTTTAVSHTTDGCEYKT